MYHNVIGSVKDDLPSWRGHESVRVGLCGANDGSKTSPSLACIERPKSKLEGVGPVTAVKQDRSKRRSIKQDAKGSV